MWAARRFLLPFLLLLSQPACAQYLPLSLTDAERLRQEGVHAAITRFGRVARGGQKLHVRAVECADAMRSFVIR